MSRGYRCIIVAAFGLALVAASPPSQGASSNQTATEQPRRDDVARIATALEKLPQAQAPDTGCEAGQDNRSSDLCAQWKAADGAAASAIWTERAFWLGVCGLIVGFLTLAAAGFAAWYARHAAFETKRSADAATKQIAFAEETAIRQLKAYIGIEQGGIERSPNGVCARITLRNFGQTPAYFFKSAVGLHVRPKNHKIGIMCPEDGIAPIELAPSQGHLLEAEPEADNAINAMFPPQGMVYYVIISCTFQDAFGNDSVFKTCLIDNGSGGLAPYPFEDEKKQS